MSIPHTPIARSLETENAALRAALIGLLAIVEKVSEHDVMWYLSDNDLDLYMDACKFLDGATDAEIRVIEPSDLKD